MASGHVNRNQTPNTWLHRATLRREDSPCQLGAVHIWPRATVFALQPNVRLQGYSDCTDLLGNPSVLASPAKRQASSNQQCGR